MNDSFLAGLYKRMTMNSTKMHWPRRLATAYFTLALLTVVGTIGVLAWTWWQPTAHRIDALHQPTWYAVAATLLYLAALSATMFVWSARWKEGVAPAAPPERWKWRAALAAATVAVAWTALSGVGSRAWLAGLDALLVATLVVSSIAMLIEVISTCTCSPRPSDVSNSDGVTAWVSRGVLLAALALLASLVYLESRPLPHTQTSGRVVDRELDFAGERES